jgi:hypothetical protein
MSIEDASQAIINAADRKIKLAVFPGWFYTGLLIYNIYPQVYDKAIIAEAKL